MDFTFALLDTITNSFSDEQKVGDGGSAYVYKAVHNGEEIAVKKLHPFQGLDDKKFHNEFLNLTKVSHRNVVRLIGYCHESRSKYIKHNGELVFAKIMERLLCFEYMHGGTLSEYIDDEHCTLDWPTCYKIIQGTCEGLNHLHNAQEKPIFHLDLQPSHLLLDKNMTPKIAGFGVSRLVASTRSHQTEVPYVSSFMPPEYLDRGIISKKFDVFCLGIIILKMMAGNRGYFQHSEKSADQFVELVCENWKERLQRRLSYEVDILQVRTCVEIALRCVNTDRTKRPTIADIVNELGDRNAEINTIMSWSHNHKANWVGEMHINMDFTLALIETITNNFSEDQKIGSGGYGDVYKAVHNGAEIAVKKLHPLQGLDDNKLDSEYRNLNKVRHQNVARLIGYCYESQHKYMEHNGELVHCKMMLRILCFEYVNGGSLDRYIADESCGLDWPTCYGIIKGTCEGLNHLHNVQGEPILHLNLKPSNILLDKSMMPKIADVGLSRLLASTQTEIIQGTQEYMPPEYINRGLISEKFDVFSLGVIIIKLVAGNMGFLRSSEVSPKQFIELVSENWKKRFQTVPGHSSYEIDILRVCTCVEIALKCVDADRNKRPSIKDILWQLDIKTIISKPTDHKSISFVLDSQSRSIPAPDQRTGLIETVIKTNLTEEIKTNITEADIKTNLTEAEIQTTLSVPPYQSGIDSWLCSTTASDYSRDQIEAEIETIMSLPPDHKSKWSSRDSQSRSITDQSKDLLLQTGSKLQHLPLQYLKDITNNFCDEQILGRGGFGVVYKGVLQNGRCLAVKKLLKAMPISLRQFENEVNLLMNLKHPNIVRLVGYCYETQHLPMPHEGKIFFDWNTESLLCLECLPNGSLDNHISDASSGLDWSTRWKLIEGISYGLQYLHEQSKNPILHLDLKPANILLDENMLPKITDFGLSRLIDQEQTIYTINMGGTLGYMPPEYLRRIITPKSDIFSLGVIIMEIITGHRNYPDNIKASSHDFIERELQEWRNRLQKEPGYASLEPDCQQIKRCIQIGLICVNPERTKRPTMKKVIDMLEGLETMNWYISNELSNLAIHVEE